MKRFYDYRCPVCNSIKENVFIDIDKDEFPLCDKCGNKMKKLMTPVSVHYKGSGFYTTDYTNKGK